MMQALPDADRTRLAKLLGLLGSDHPGERDAAACAAHKLVRQRGLTWTDVISPRLPSSPPQPEPEPEPQSDWLDDLLFSQRNFEFCSPWEQDFIQSVSKFRRFSQKQQDCLGRIADKLRARGFA